MFKLKHKQKKVEQRIRDMQNIVKWSDIGHWREGEEKENEPEVIFKEIVAENFPRLVKNTNQQTLYVPGTLSGIKHKENYT